MLGSSRTFFPFFIHCCLLHLRPWNKHVNQIVMGHRIKKPLPAMVLFMMFRLRRFHSLPCGFMRFHHALMNRFLESVGMQSPTFATTFVMPFGDLLHSMTAARGLSKLYPRILDSFCVISVIRINKVNSSQSSSIVESWFLVCPFLLFSLLRSFSDLGPYLRPHILRSGSRLNFLSVTPNHINPFGGFSFDRVNPLHESDISLFESTFQ